MQATDQLAPHHSPPLFVAMTDRQGRRITRLFTPDVAPEGVGGEWLCEVTAPSGMKSSGTRAFDGAPTSDSAYGAILSLFRNPDPLALWFWRWSPSDQAEVVETDGIGVWSGDERVSEVQWLPIARTGGGALLALLALGTERDELTLEIPVDGGPALFMPLRANDLVHVGIEEHAGQSRAFWRVVADPHMAAAYWSYHRIGVLDAASAIALRILEGLERDRDLLHLWPESEANALVTAHAAIKLRSLGAQYRERVRSILADWDTDSVDLEAVRWMLRFDLPGRTGPDSMGLLRALSERLLVEMPLHSEILKLLFERYPLVAGTVDAAPPDPVLANGLEHLSRFAHAANWDFDTLAYHATSPRRPVDDVDWDEIEPFASTEKKSPPTFGMSI